MLNLNFCIGCFKVEKPFVEATFKYVLSQPLGQSRVILRSLFFFGGITLRHRCEVMINGGGAWNQVPDRKPRWGTPTAFEN